MVALEVALRNLNTSSQDLLLNTTELESTDPLQAASSAQKLIQQGAQVIISTGTWPQVLGISDVGKRQQVPTIALTPSAFLNKPFLVQMSYPDSALVNCFAAIIKSYKWRRVIAVYEDDDYGTVSDTTLLLSHALQEVGAQLEYSLVFPPMDDSKSDLSTIIQDEWHRMKERRIFSTVYIILRMSENLVLSFFKEATALGMLHNGSAWICGPDVTTLLDSTLLDPSLAFNWTDMQGVIVVQPYVDETTTEYLNFKNSFQQTFKSKYENNGGTSFSPGVYAVRAYDATHAVISAMNRVKVNSSSLVNTLLASNFSGLSGLITPLKDDSTYEMHSKSIFRVVNVVGKSYKEIGLWSNSSGFYNELQLNPNGSSSLEQLRVVLWTGDATMTTPAGVRTLKIGILNSTTWGRPEEIEINGKTINSTSMNGFCIGVFIAAMQKLNPGISYEFQFYPKPGIGFDYNAFVNKVKLEEVDIVVGDVTVTSERMKTVSFTEPFIASANQLQPVVDTSKIGCDGDSFVVGYLKNVLRKENIVEIENPDDYSVKFENGDITAAYIESPYVPEFLSKNKHYAVYGETQMLGGFAFVLQKGDPMIADLSRAIVELQEDGTIQKLEDKWFSTSVCTIGTVESKSDSQPLGFGVFWILFVFSSGVSLITLVAFIVLKHAIAQRKKKQIVPDLERDGQMVDQVSQIQQTYGATMHEP
ncbi:Glutamate receptor [Rhynchospora pubera]|uniref:Glutamate receptor n=1 Tax=Rhynchospora pubera TaxID=906938 RepID=A0AAV8E3B3_9POAL|nr:Glutamate receptor [Rhynchospora pubera]